MKTPKSLNLLTGLFTGLLVGLGNHHLKDLYIPWKQSIAEDNLPLSILLGLELFLLLAIAGGIIKLVMNINNKQFFAKLNHICLYIMGSSFLVLGLIGSILIQILIQEVNEINYIMCLIIGVFLFIIAEIFRYGYHLKEEQELTI